MTSYIAVRGNSRDKEAVLVAHGIDREGKRVVLHLSLGGRVHPEGFSLKGEHGVVEGSAK